MKNIPWKMLWVVAKQLPGMKVRDAVSTVVTTVDTARKISASRNRQDAGGEWAIVQVTPTGKSYTIGSVTYSQAFAVAMAANYNECQPEFRHFAVRVRDSKGNPVPWTIRLRTGFFTFTIINSKPQSPQHHA